MASSWAQNTTNYQNIRGRVLDAETHLPLIGANVKITNINPAKVTVTDENGEFHFLQIPTGHYSLSATYVGYEAQVISDLYVESSKEAYLRFYLEQVDIGIGEVMVIPKNKKAEPLNPSAVVSAIQFSMEETSKFSGSLNDPARMVSAFPGITASHDASNEIIIRGNSPMGMQWRIEDVEVPNPNHFSDLGATGGAISMLSSYMMGNSDFLSGNFPVEYGNATSGVFDIHLRTGNDIYRNFSLQTGVIGLNASAEGPTKLGVGGSYLVNYRYSTLSILNALGVSPLGSATPDYQDLAFNINIPMESKGRLNIWGIGGISKLNENLSKLQHKYGYNMATLGANYQIWTKNRSLINFALATWGTNNTYSVNLLPSATIANELEVYRYSVIHEAVTGNIAITQKLNSYITLKSGIDVSVTPFIFSITKNDTLFKDDNFQIDNKGTSTIAQAYTSMRWSFTSKWTTYLGVHGLYSLLNNKYAIEPRFNIKWQFLPRQSMALGIGNYSRTETITQYFIQRENPDGTMYYPDKNLDLTRSTQYGLSYNFNITTNLFFRAEIYYQHQYNVPVKNEVGSHISLINVNSNILNEELVNKGFGENKGVEFMLQKFYNEGTFHLISLSLFDSKYQGYDSPWYNTAFNNKFAIQVLSGREINFAKNRLVGFSARMHWYGGRRYTPIDLAKSIERGYAAYDETNIYGAQSEDYFRIDFQFRYVSNKPKFTSEWRLDIQNITNKLNMFGIYYNPYTQEIENTYQTGLVPVISYTISFNRD